MSDPTRFPNGVSTATPEEFFGTYPLPDPFHSSSSDNAFGSVSDVFDFMRASDITEFTVTGTGTPAMALVSGNGGLAALTTTIGAADSVIAIKAIPTIALAAGKKAWYLTRFALSDATTCAIVAGLKDAVTESNGVWFSKASASLSVTLNIKVATVATTVTGITLLANATYLDIGWYYDGTDLLAYVNDVVVARVSAASLPTVALTEVLSITNGSGVIRSMTVDYVMAATELVR